MEFHIKFQLGIILAFNLLKMSILIDIFRVDYFQGLNFNIQNLKRTSLNWFFKNLMHLYLSFKLKTLVLCDPLYCPWRKTARFIVSPKLMFRHFLTNFFLQNFTYHLNEFSKKIKNFCVAISSFISKKLIWTKQFLWRFILGKADIFYPFKNYRGLFEQFFNVIRLQL